MVAALVWALADGAMGRPADLMAFAEIPSGSRTWRVAHLSDLHAVGERYGFRIESGRTGPQGNGSLPASSTGWRPSTESSPWTSS